MPGYDNIQCQGLVVSTLSYRSVTGIFWYSRHRDQARCYAVTPKSDKYLTEGLDTPPQLRDCSSQLTVSRTRRGGQSLLLAPSHLSRFSTHAFWIVEPCSREHLEKISSFTDSSFTKLYEWNEQVHCHERTRETAGNRFTTVVTNYRL